MKKIFELTHNFGDYPKGTKLEYDTNLDLIVSNYDGYKICNYREESDLIDIGLIREVIPGPQFKFNVGDNVRLIKAPTDLGEYYLQIGIVRESSSDIFNEKCLYHIEFPDNFLHWVRHDCLQLVSFQPKFKVGDRVKFKESYDKTIYSVEITDGDSDWRKNTVRISAGWVSPAFLQLYTEPMTFASKAQLEGFELKENDKVVFEVGNGRFTFKVKETNGTYYLHNNGTEAARLLHNRIHRWVNCNISNLSDLTKLVLALYDECDKVNKESEYKWQRGDAITSPTETLTIYHTRINDDGLIPIVTFRIGRHFHSQNELEGWGWKLLKKAGE